MIEGMNLPDDKKKLADDLEHLPVNPKNVKRMAEEYLRVTDPDIRELIEDFLFFKGLRERSVIEGKWEEMCAAPVAFVWGEIPGRILEKVIRTCSCIDLLFNRSSLLQKNIEEKKHLRDAYVERIMESGDMDKAEHMLRKIGIFLDKAQLAECVRKILHNRGEARFTLSTEYALIWNWGHMSQSLRKEVTRIVTLWKSPSSVVNLLSNEDVMQIGEDAIRELMDSILSRESVKTETASAILSRRHIPDYLKRYFAEELVSNPQKISDRGAGVTGYSGLAELTNLLPAGYRKPVIEFFLGKSRLPLSIGVSDGWKTPDDKRDSRYILSLNPEALWEGWGVIREHLSRGRWAEEIRDEAIKHFPCRCILVSKEILDPSDFALVWGDRGEQLFPLIRSAGVSRLFEPDMECLMRNVVSAFCPERGGPLRYEVQEDWIGDGGKSSIKFFNRVHQYLADKGDGETFLLVKEFLSTLSDAIREETMSDPVREAYESLCTLIQTMENERMCAVHELLPTDGIL